MDNNQDQTSYTPDTVPDDAQISSKQQSEFTPLDDGETYQVEVGKLELRDNPFYKAGAEDAKPSQKYRFNFEYIVLNEGENYGRLLWDSTSLSFKPDSQKGPTKLYKIVTKAMKTEMDWMTSASFAPSVKTFMQNCMEQVIGKQLRVTIENTKNPETGKVRTKIISYSESKKDLKAYDPKDEKKAKKAVDATKDESVNPDDIPF